MGALGSKERVCPGSFKQTVVEDKLHSNLGYRAIGRKYNVPHNLVIVWVKKYAEQGVESLYIDNRGAPGIKRNPRKPASHKRSREATIRQLDAKLDQLNNIPFTDDERVELEHLRMENAYLKKLRALAQD